MKVGFATRFSWPVVGGVEQHVRTLATELAAKHDVRILAHRIDDQGTEWMGELDRSPAFASFQDPNSGVTTTQLRLANVDLPLLLPLGRAVRSSYGLPGHQVISDSFEASHRRIASRRFAAQLAGAEIVHRFGGNRMALATVRAGARLEVPVVITPFAHPGQWDCDPVSAQAYREADVVIASSRADSATYEDLGVEPDRIRICPLPTSAPPVAAAPRPPAVAAVHGPIVLFLGARRSHKGVDALIDASRLLETEAAATVAFVGPGPELRAPLPSNVLDVGPVSDAERSAWLAAADVVCLPSSAESWGLVVSEAWSHSVPVVTSDIPVLKERVMGAEGGLAVPARPPDLAAALGMLLDDDNMRRRMGAAGRHFWEANLTPAAIASWHEDAYTRLIEQKHHLRATDLG